MVDEPDREAPTPRLTREWDMMRSAAQELSNKLRAMELRFGRVGPELDTAHADLLRRVRSVVDTYAAHFGRWSTEPVTTEVKQREQKEFFALAPYVKLMTEEG